MKLPKAWSVLTASAALAAMMATPALADSSTEIYYNDTLLNTSQPVITVEGRTLLAFRDLFENLNGDVVWDDTYRMASVTYGKTTINLFPDTGSVQINGTPQAVDVGPQIIDNRVYLPLRFVAQSLGGTVDYSQAKDGSASIRIYTADSQQNFARKDGKVTTILRTTADAVNQIEPNEKTKTAYNNWKTQNTVYFMDDHNNLVEVQSYDSKIQTNIIDFTAAKTVSYTYDTNTLYPALTNVKKDGKTYNIGINEETQSARYVGVGSAQSTNYETVLDTDCGDITVYKGSNTRQVLQFDASGDTATITNIKETGKLLDLVHRNSIPSHSSYAVAENGNYAFLLDGQLLIINGDNDILEDVVFTSTAGDSQVFAVGNKFVVIAVENGMHYPEIYAAVYNADGSVVHYFQNISQISKVKADETFYEYKNLNIKDAKLFGNTLYILAKTNMDYYIITYNIATNAFTKEQLSIKEKNYEGFIDTMNDVKLFAADEYYFYLRDVK